MPIHVRRSLRLLIWLMLILIVYACGGRVEEELVDTPESATTIAENPTQNAESIDTAEFVCPWDTAAIEGTRWRSGDTAIGFSDTGQYAYFRPGAEAVSGRWECVDSSDTELILTAGFGNYERRAILDLDNDQLVLEDSDPLVTDLEFVKVVESEDESVVAECSWDKSQALGTWIGEGGALTLAANGTYIYRATHLPDSRVLQDWFCSDTAEPNILLRTSSGQTWQIEIDLENQVLVFISGPDHSSYSDPHYYLTELDSGSQ